MILDSTMSLELLTDAGTDVTFICSAVNDSGAALDYAPSSGLSNGLTPVVVVAAPAASNDRVVKQALFRNTAGLARVVTVRVVAAGQNRVLRVVTLQPGESLEYDGARWRHYDWAGRELVATISGAAGLDGYSLDFLKGGTASEAAASGYSYLKDAGLPGAFTPGTPGLAGRAIDGATEPGMLPYRNAAVGENYLTRFVITGSVIHTFELYDLLWINSGIVVTTVGAQVINSVAFPARDVAGAVNGRGCRVGLLFVAASSNASPIANATLLYTNSLGVSGRTATLLAVAGMQIPASPVIGTIVWFRLAAGDVGLESIQEVALGTSLVTGTVSLIVARKLDVAAGVAANLAAPGLGGLVGESVPGARLYDGTAMFLAQVSAATTATQIQGSVAIMER